MMHDRHLNRLAWSLQEESDAAALFADPTMDEVRLQVLWEAAVKVGSNVTQPHWMLLTSGAYIRSIHQEHTSGAYSAPALTCCLAGHAHRRLYELSTGSCPPSCAADALVHVLLFRQA